LVEQRKHFGVLHPFSGGHPLHIAVAIAASGTHAVGVVYKPGSDHRNGFKTPVWMPWETRNSGAVIHSKTVFNDEILTHVATFKIARVRT
jgi:hypothetical protein